MVYTTYSWLPLDVLHANETRDVWHLPQSIWAQGLASPAPPLANPLPPHFFRFSDADPLPQGEPLFGQVPG